MHSEKIKTNILISVIQNALTYPVHLYKYEPLFVELVHIFDLFINFEKNNTVHLLHIPCIFLHSNGDLTDIQKYSFVFSHFLPTVSCNMSHFIFCCKTSLQATG